MRWAVALLIAFVGCESSQVVSFDERRDNQHDFAPRVRRVSGSTMVRVALFRPTVRARVRGGLEKKAGRLHFVRVHLERSDGPNGEIWAESTGNQSSGVLRSMTLAQGLLVFPAEATRIADGEPATVQVLDESFFAGETPGF